MEHKVTLGQLIKSEAQRDAIHIAVAPVVAGEDLQPGQRVVLGPAGAVGGVHPFLGIVDPFLNQTVWRGERFWLLLRPGTVTSLRHEWEHPAFEVLDFGLRQLAARAWLEQFGQQVGKSYAELLDIGRDALETGSAHVGKDETQDAFNEAKLPFLANAAVLLDLPVPADESAVYFSCAC